MEATVNAAFVSVLIGTERNASQSQKLIQHLPKAHRKKANKIHPNKTPYKTLRIKVHPKRKSFTQTEDFLLRRTMHLSTERKEEGEPNHLLMSNRF